MAEVRRNLRCSHFYIQHEETTKNFKISLEKDQVILRTNATDKQSISLKREFEVDIQSLSNLVVEKENTSFRITIIPSDESSFTETLPLTVLPAPIKENQPIQLKCITCKTNLLEKKTLTFTRVLEYPSGSLDVCEFFCHNGPDFTSKLAPKATDLFYGFQFLVINLEILSNRKEKDNHFYCRRCLSYLGQRLQENVAKIWSDNVRIEVENTVTPRVDRRLFVEQLFHKIIAECSVNRDIAHCMQFSKVILETILPTRQKRFLMVNVLEKNLEILKSSDVASAFDLESRRAYKVLFKYEEDDENPLLVFWKNDFNVHSISVSHKMFTNVLNVLAEGNRIFPSIYRLTKDFMTSFIFYSS